MKSRDLIKRLERGGFRKARSGGGHDIYENPQTGKVVILPRHREVNENTAKQILKDAGLA